jgi:hypothetical protein
MNGNTLRPGERLVGWLLHPWARNGVVLLAVLGVWWALYARGYPWWLWAPACFLTPFVVVWLWLMAAYSYQKATYPRRALEAKRRRKREREGE